MTAATRRSSAPQQRATGADSSASGGAGPAASRQPAEAGAAALLAVESKVRAARNETQLVHLIANEMRQLVGGRQAIVLRARRPGKLEVACVSSLVVTEQDTPFIRWIENMVGRLVREHGDRSPVEFELPAFVDSGAAETRAYPFPHLVWQPMQLGGGETFAGLLLARERPWGDTEKRIVEREAAVFAGTWQALYGAAAMRPRRLVGKRTRLVLAAAAAIAMLLPVPMTTLAPVEIVPRQPQRVTAPIDGVIKEILVEPNRLVQPGQPILRFEETVLRNRMQIAEQEMLVARARFERASQAAFLDDKARHELAQAQAELRLKQAERDYAGALLARAVVVAERGGILVYADKDRWIGRPVRTGERIMQIVEPAEVAARIEVPVADAIVLERGALVRLFLDADPLSSVPARLVSEGYHAEPNATQQLVYRLHAELDGKVEGLRIGARGTAQLVGDYVPLAFYLLRRPISALRQHIGL